MAVKKCTIQFPGSGSLDVVGYNMYIEESSNPVSTDSEKFDLGNPIDGQGVCSVDLSSLPGMITKDGIYNIGIESVDDAGNSSSMSVVNGVSLDFLEPDPPGLITIIRS